MKLLTRGNSKLGSIAAYSHPVISSCPGRSKLCESVCYADRKFMKWHQPRYQKNKYVFDSDLHEWVKQIQDDLNKTRQSVVRIHVSGDFDNARYIHAWNKIVKNNPNKHFFAYTRSWRKVHLLPALLKLSALNNFTLNLSCDKETGIPSTLARKHKLRLCYMAMNDSDIPKKSVGIVFRVTHDTIVKNMNGQVCPYETGLPNITHFVRCDKCKLCIKKPVRREATYV